ncbi:MAG: protein phosphatase CheZ [Sulfurimicrobium sp.]|nr:protein phosphatase CheZ [Sulfurimicrobium sp.]MDO9188369.1 protein phosphatase CheZ [Sulfurimicrobium sp.]MDP2200361.1 protein phosphatase CheZ [Sulfurimicrobium sp.]MDP2963160.1 protein phosphatase CheZ [Sulfurimicrobium sp.]MDZ7654613.1 protein phosphatase CheZ [Sulfurimicrobium sp.]
MSNTPQNSGDSDDLEALFDSIVMASQATEPPAEATPPKSSAADTSTTTVVDSGDESSSDKVFSSLGHMTRKLHDTLRELGYDKTLEKAVEGLIPDTRDRLNYIAVKTEQAAERALSATEVAQPLQEKIESGASALSGKWDRMFSNQLSVDEFKQLVSDTRSYLHEVPKHTQATNAQLMEIMMAQDFQDLTGQVIKKVIDLAQQVETQLLQLLIDSTPAEKRNEVDIGLLNGPVVNTEGRSDIVTNQQQVDDLLESLGF